MVFACHSYQEINMVARGADYLTPTSIFPKHDKSPTMPFITRRFSIMIKHKTKTEGKITVVEEI